MAQEEKSLLLQDLCARLPYGVKSKSQASHLEINTIDGYFVDGDGTKIFHLSEPDIWQEVEHFQYYLRPISSMTEEERKELSHYDNSVQRTDFFYSHHIDCRFMIEKGLVLEAPKDMYNI